MHYAFQDRENLYILMDYLGGGDLRYHISRQKKFTENQASNKNFFCFKKALIICLLFFLLKKTTVNVKYFIYSFFYLRLLHKKFLNERRENKIGLIKFLTK